MTFATKSMYIRLLGMMSWSWIALQSTQGFALPTVPANIGREPTKPAATSPCAGKKPTKVKNVWFCTLELSELCSVYQQNKGSVCSGKATVLYPASLRYSNRVEVLLYFHGHNPQQIVDPNQKDVSLKEPRYAYDLIAEQMAESHHPSMMAILPHGSNDAQFAPNPENAEPHQGILVNDFLQEVFTKLQEGTFFSRIPTLKSLMLTAHSGGGTTVTNLLQHAEKYQLPLHLVSMVAYFDAINGSMYELPFVKQFLECHIPSTFKNDAHPCDFFPESYNPMNSNIYFRAYHTTSEWYTQLHETLIQALKGWFPEKPTTSDSPKLRNLKTHFQVVSVPSLIGSKRVGHSQLVRNYLKVALQALPPGNQNVVAKR